MTEGVPSGLAAEVVASLLAQLDRRARLKEMVAALSLRLSSRNHRARLFVCGGLLRDLAIAAARGTEALPGDLDLVVEGLDGRELHAVLSGLACECGAVRRVARVGASFPVWKIAVDGEPEAVDVAVLRSERSFNVGREELDLPSAELTVEDDGRHRDFTMNALYVELRLDGRGRLRGRFDDFHDGLGAIAAGEIRCVGSAADRLREDPLRALRAVRFATTLAGFTIEARTAAAVRSVAPSVALDVAGDRLGGELCRMLGTKAELALDLLADLHLLDSLVPELAVLGEPARRRTAHRIAHLGASPPASAQLVFAALLAELAVRETRQRRAAVAGPMTPAVVTAAPVRAVARRLHLPDVRRISRLCRSALVLVHYPVLENRDAAVEEVLADTAFAPEVIRLYAAVQEAGGSAVLPLGERVRALAPCRLDFGALVAELGLAPGPHLQDLRRALRQAEIDGQIHSAQDARLILDTLLTKPGQGAG